MGSHLMATIGALLLLSISILTINRNETLALESMEQAKMNQYAFNLAKSYLDVVRAMPYDETIVQPNIDYGDCYYKGYNNKILTFPAYFGRDFIKMYDTSGAFIENEDLRLDSTLETNPDPDKANHFYFDDVDDFDGYSLQDSMKTRFGTTYFTVWFDIVPYPDSYAIQDPAYDYRQFNKIWYDSVKVLSGNEHLFDNYKGKIILVSVRSNQVNDQLRNLNYLYTGPN